ncbi:MAG TPA: lysophospholipid acyltransferase family protein [Nocardioidaceae bacterium]|nr:lysophospholipid acyltransferase family protein [Nocardioidaceae bacterium]
MDLVYPPVIGAAQVLYRLLGLDITITGAEHIPRSGGAVLASNHVSYLDFIFCGQAALPSKRLVRFMAKDAVFAHRLSGPLMRGMRHIPVDRDAGASSYAAALRALRAGEVIGVFPEATISRSFTVKEIKNGAVRLAQGAGVPLIPVALWGGQRLWSKDLPRDLTTRGRALSIAVGEPMHPTRRGDATGHADELRTRMQALLDDVQVRHRDQPAAGEEAPWHPRHHGGTAPTPAEAAELDRAGRRVAPD